MNKQDKEKLFNCKDLTVGFNNVLNSLITEYEDYYERLKKSENEAISNIEKQFSEKRKAAETREERITSELKSYLKDLVRYSTFKIDSLEDFNMLDILTDIISVYRGEKYRCSFIKDTEKDICNLLIYPEYMKISYKTDIKEMLEKGVVFSFRDDYIVMDNVLNFYKLFQNGVDFSSSFSINELQDIVLTFSENCNKHDFILEFITLVVKYRMENKRDEITYAELKRLEQIFILENREKIKEINAERARNERNDLEYKITSRNLFLTKYFYDNLDNNEEIQDKIKSSDNTSGKMLKKLIEKYNETSED